MEFTQWLDPNEQKEISSLLLQLFEYYPDIDYMLQSANKKRLHFDTFPDDVALVLSPLPGAANISEDVTGAETNQYPFTLSYQKNAGNDLVQVSIKEDLDAMAFWAQNLREFPSLSDKREIEEIKVGLTSELIGRETNGYVIYSCQMMCTYRKLK